MSCVASCAMSCVVSCGRDKRSWRTPAGSTRQFCEIRHLGFLHVSAIVSVTDSARVHVRVTVSVIVGFNVRVRGRVRV